ncbi:MAG: hypothetical protein ACHQUC_03555 [Chlamydiales bacterium]
MNNLNVFYQTSTEGDNAQIDLLKTVGDCCLAPVRYFFRGRNVEFIGLNDNEITSIYDYASYFTIRNKFLLSNALEKKWMRTCLCIIGFIPGLILGSIFKGLSYLKKSIRDEHDLVKLHFEREEHLLINHSAPYSKHQPHRISFALEEARKRVNPKAKDVYLHQRVNIVEINLAFSKDAINERSVIVPLIEFDPVKLILHTKVFIEDDESAVRHMASSGKWLTVEEGSQKKLLQKSVSSVAEALADQLPLRPNSTKPYKCVYLIQS